MKKLNAVLLVDDSAAVNYYNQTLINRKGICESVFIARHGKEALELLEKTNASRKILPEIIFLDLNMPIMNGWEFLEEFQEKALLKNSGTKIIILTSSINPEDQKKALKISIVDEYLKKPMNPKTLNDILDRYFS